MESSQIENKLKGIFQLLKESWIFYFSKIGTLLGIMAIPIGFSFLKEFLINFLIETTFKYSFWFPITLTLFSLTSLFLWLLAIPSLIFVLKEKKGIKESLKKGTKIFIPFLWVYFLFNAIILGGLILFFIPAILFFTWFSLAIFVLVFEGKRGMSVLFKSRYLAAGKFWGVLRRYLGLAAIFLVFVALSFGPTLFLLRKNKIFLDRAIEILIYLFQLFFTPFSLIYMALIYENLEEIKKAIPYFEPSIKRKLKYIFPIILGSLIIVAPLSFNFLNIFLGRDEPPPDDKDLWLSKVEIPKEENALYYLIPHLYFRDFEKEAILKYWPEEKERLEKFAKIYYPEEKEELIKNIIEGKEWDEEFVKDLLENNKQVLASFEKAAKSPYFQDPAFQDPKTIGPQTPIFFPLGQLREIANLKLIESIYLFKKGEQEKAIEGIIQTIQFGQLMEDSPRPTLIEYLFGMGIKAIGLGEINLMIPEISLSPEALKRYINKIERFKLNENGLKNVLKMEYIFSANSKAKIEAAIRRELSEEEMKELGFEGISLERKMMEFGFYFKPNKTQRMFAEHFRNLINNVDKNCKEAKFPEIEASPSTIKMLITENAIGKFLYEMTTITHEGIFYPKCEEDFSVIGTQTLLALKMYQIEKGKLPSSLNELIPRYFSEVPKDPFDGEPVKYSLEKKIIYSVGRDLKDSGGIEKEDIVFKIEF